MSERTDFVFFLIRLVFGALIFETGTDVAVFYFWFFEICLEHLKIFLILGLNTSLLHNDFVIFVLHIVIYLILNV